jgi:hypothetical protein
MSAVKIFLHQQQKKHKNLLVDLINVPILVINSLIDICNFLTGEREESRFTGAT